MKDLAASLLIWIALQLGGEPPPAPEIRLCPETALVERYSGGIPPAHPPFVCGLYDSRSRIVYLPDTWRADSLLDRSALLHELVHHVQVVRAMPYPCPAARERLAYELQARWLKENGVADPYALLKVDEFTITIRSLCLPPQ